MPSGSAAGGRSGRRGSGGRGRRSGERSPERASRDGGAADRRSIAEPGGDSERQGDGVGCRDEPGPSSSASRTTGSRRFPSASTPARSVSSKSGAMLLAWCCMRSLRSIEAPRSTCPRRHDEELSATAPGDLPREPRRTPAAGGVGRLGGDPEHGRGPARVCEDRAGGEPAHGFERSELARAPRPAAAGAAAGRPRAAGAAGTARPVRGPPNERRGLEPAALPSPPSPPSLSSLSSPPIPPHFSGPPSPYPPVPVPGSRKSWTAVARASSAPSLSLVSEPST